MPFAIFSSLMTVWGFVGGFGPGAVLLLISLPTTIIAIIWHFYSGILLQGKTKKGKPQTPIQRWYTFIVVLVMITGISLSPIIGYGTITQFCYQHHVVVSQPIIVALDNYRLDHDAYPSELEELVPIYLDSIPRPTCLQFSPFQGDYQIVFCNVRSYNGEDYEVIGIKSILWLDVVQSGFMQRYALETGQWSSVSVFDGICSFLD